MILVATKQNTCLLPNGVEDVQDIFNVEDDILIVIQLYTHSETVKTLKIIANSKDDWMSFDGGLSVQLDEMIAKLRSLAEYDQIGKFIKISSYIMKNMKPIDILNDMLPVYSKSHILNHPADTRDKVRFC